MNSNWQYINPYNLPHPYTLTDKQRVFIKRWETERKKPKLQFYFIDGFIKQVSWIFLAFKFIQLIFLKSETQFLYSTGTGVLFLIIELLFWIFCGVVLGWMKFTQKETEFELFKSMRHF